MAVFTRGDLKYTGYKDTAHPNDDPRLTGKPDSTLLNRGESYEMTYFINRYMEENGWKQVSTGQKIEKYLQDSDHKGKSHKFWRDALKANFKP